MSKLLKYVSLIRKLYLLGFIFLGLVTLFVSPSRVSADCGNWTIVGGGTCTIVNGIQCTSNPTRCCNPASECNTNPNIDCGTWNFGPNMCSIPNGNQCPQNLGKCCVDISKCDVAACEGPPGPAFDSCPKPTHPYACYVPNSETGVSDLTCCPTQTQCENFIAAIASPSPGGLQAKKICEFAGDQQEECEKCRTAGGILTPLGCIKTNIQDFIRQLLTIAISIGGGIAFIMIVYGGFTLMTSAGNPERLTSGKEIITSAIAGLLLIIFSVVILKIIGVDILQIPGLG